MLHEQTTATQDFVQTELQWEHHAPGGTSAPQQEKQHGPTAGAQTMPVLLKHALQQAEAIEHQSQAAQTDKPLLESQSTQTLTHCTTGMSQQSQTEQVEQAQQITQLTQTLLHSQQEASSQTEQPQHPQPSFTQQTQTVVQAPETASTQTDHRAAKHASQRTQTQVLQQQHASTQSHDACSQVSQQTQTASLLLLPASTQTAVEVMDAACQSCTGGEKATAAEQRLEAMQGELAGLRLKVQSLQGIVDIQEQQLKAAAGQGSSGEEQVSFTTSLTPAAQAICEVKISMIRRSKAGCCTLLALLRTPHMLHS